MQHEIHTVRPWVWARSSVTRCQRAHSLKASLRKYVVCLYLSFSPSVCLTIEKPPLWGGFTVQQWLLLVVSSTTHSSTHSCCLENTQTHAKQRTPSMQPALAQSHINSSTHSHTHMCTMFPSDNMLCRHTHTQTLTQYTLYYACSQRRNRRLLGFSSCLLSIQLPPHCFPSLSPFSVPSFVLLRFCLQLSLQLPLSSIPSYSLPPTHSSLYWSLSYYLALHAHLFPGLPPLFFTAVTSWVTDSICVQSQLLCWHR